MHFVSVQTFTSFLLDNYKIAELLIKSGTDLNIKDDPWTPLSHAITRGQHLFNSDAWKLLFCIVSIVGKFKIAELCILNGADLNFVYKYGYHVTPLNRAIAQTDFDPYMWNADPHLGPLNKGDPASEGKNITQMFMNPVMHNPYIFTNVYGK